MIQGNVCRDVTMNPSHVQDLHQQHRIGAIWQTTASLHSSSSSSSSYHSRLDSTTCPPLRAANKFIVPWWELRGAGGQGHGMPLALLRQTAGYASQPLPQAKSGDGKEVSPLSTMTIFPPHSPLLAICKTPHYSRTYRRTHPLR